MKRFILLLLILLPFVVTLVLHVIEWNSNRQEVNWSNHIISERNSDAVVDRYREQLWSEYRQQNTETKENEG